MKTIRNVLVFFFAVMLLCQCTKDTDDNTINEDISSEYSVYSAILDQGFDKIKKPLVVKQTSDAKKSFAFDENVYEDRIAPEGIGKAVFDDLLLKNDTVYELENKFSISPRTVELINSSDLQAVFSVDGPYSGWEGFYEKYPDSGGYIYFSKVGFDKDKTKALVEYGYIFGGLGAEGGFAYLEREDDAWVLRKFILVWLS